MRRSAAGLILLTLSLLSSCGYRPGQGSCMSGCHTICIPYVDGDQKGYLTRELVRAVSAAPQLIYQKCDAEWVLNVHLCGIHEDHIGYRYDSRGERGDIRQRIIPSEARASVLAEVCITERPTGKALLGPIRVEAAIDYDFDTYANHSGDNIFSLGQLNDRDVSRDLVPEPLFRELAIQIMDYVKHGW